MTVTTAGFMASVTCGLTAEDRDQLRNPTLVSSMVLPLPAPDKFHFTCGHVQAPLQHGAEDKKLSFSTAC